MRLIIVMLLCSYATAAAALVTCDQLGNIALATEEYRKQGVSLAALMVEADKLESSGNMSKEEVLLVRRTVQQTFDRTRTALEIRMDCTDVPAKSR